MSNKLYQFAKKHEQRLEALMIFLRDLEKFLGPEDDWVEDDTRIIFEFLDGFGGHKFVYHEDETDYVFTANVQHEAFERFLMEEGGYQRNLLSAHKYRTYHEGGKQYATSSLVLDPVDDPKQHHVYIFPTEDGRTDVHAHSETSVREGTEHLTDKMDRADVGGLKSLLDAHGIQYGTREFNND